VVDGADMMGRTCVGDISPVEGAVAAFLTTLGNVSNTVGGIMDKTRTDIARGLK